MSMDFSFRQPTILIINGHSSASKTSTIEILQRYCQQPIFQLSFDSFFLSLGPKYLGIHSKEGFSFHSYLKEDATTEEKLRTEIHYGKYGMIAAKALPRALLYPYQEGLNVIVDDVVYYKELMDNYREVLRGTNTYFVHLYCDDVMLMGRERYRFNRSLGLGIAQQEKMKDNGWDYDLVIDNTHMTPQEVALAIVEHVNHNGPNVIQP